MWSLSYSYKELHIFDASRNEIICHENKFQNGIQQVALKTISTDLFLDCSNIHRHTQRVIVYLN